VAEYLEVDPPGFTESYRPPPDLLGERDMKLFSAAEGGPGEMVISTDPIDFLLAPQARSRFSESCGGPQSRS
jgi:hypothetical protein